MDSIKNSNACLLFWSLLHHVAVKHCTFALFIIAISFIEHTRLSSSLAGPDLSIALLSYIIIASSEKSVLIRAWLLGLAMDIWNPLTTSWYMSWYLFLAVIFLPARALVFQKSLSGWFFWAFLCHLFMVYVMAGPGDAQIAWSRLLFDATFTGFFAIGFGCLTNELPRLVHPLGGSDVP